MARFDVDSFPADTRRLLDVFFTSKLRLRKTRHYYDVLKRLNTLKACSLVAKVQSLDAKFLPDNFVFVT